MLLRGTPRRTFGAIFSGEGERGKAKVPYGARARILEPGAWVESENCSFKSMGFWLCIAAWEGSLRSEPFSADHIPKGLAFGPISLVVGSLFQAIKGVWWMPWGEVPTKDAISGETLGGAASKRRSRDIRMGKPGCGNAQSLPAEYIGRVEGTRGTETS